MAKKNTSLDIIDKIQKVRAKNNSNWMDILRLAFKHNPKESSKIMSNIYSDDQKISKLVKKLVVVSNKNNDE
tara:strand:+ start:245 stop:460 length:216 start_codon:yes stop_codon:yes gene_type:complete